MKQKLLSFALFAAGALLALIAYAARLPNGQKFR